MTPEECLKIPPSLYGGHLTDGALGAVFYGTMHGEDIWLSRGIRTEDWVPAFVKEFCTYQLPYLYLNRYGRTALTKEADGSFRAVFTDGVESTGADRAIRKNGIVLKEGGDVILPLTEDNRVFVAYSENGRSGRWNMPDAAFAEAAVSDITPDGNRFLFSRPVTGGGIELALGPGEAVVIEAG